MPSFGEVEVTARASATLSMHAVLFAICADREVEALSRRRTGPRRGVIAALTDRADEVWCDVSSSTLRSFGHPARPVPVIGEVDLRRCGDRREGEDAQGVQEVRVRHGLGGG